MNALLILSVSGGLLALILFALKPIIKTKLPKSFQYYIWLLVLLRMILPLPGITTAGDLFGSDLPTPPPVSPVAPMDRAHILNEDFTVDNKEQVSNDIPEASLPEAPQIQIPVQAQARNEIDFSEITTFLLDNLVFVWAIGAVVSLGYRIVCYARFMRGVQRDAKEVTPEQAGILDKMKLRTRVFSSVSMLVSPLAPVPMLVGIVKPRIIVPDKNYSERQLENILVHELIHLRRHDTAIKWFSVIVLSLHWFNPIVYFIQREINKACELSCDEAVIKALDNDGRQSYGDALIDIANNSTYPLGVISSSMSAKPNTLKERLVSIMEYKKPTKKIVALMMGLLLLLVGCASTLGVDAGASTSGLDALSPSPAAASPSPAPGESAPSDQGASSIATIEPGGTLELASDEGGFAITLEDIQAREKRSAEMAAKLNGKIVKLATGGGVSATLDENGNFFLWGNSWDSRLDVPEGLPPIKDIALGQYQAVALDFDGKLYGWKSNMSGPQEYGEIKFGDNLPPFVQIDANSYHTAAITADGKVYKWGDANSGNQAAVPKDLGPVKQIATGGYCTAVVLNDGSIAKWGMADYYPKDVPVKAIQVACSYYGVYALGEDGKVYGEEEQKDMQYDYIKKPNMRNIVKIAGCMALDKNGKVYAWGNDNRYRRTDITDVPLNLPKVVDIATDGMKAIALGADGKIYEWGYDNGSMPMEGGERTNFVALPKNLDGFTKTKPKYPPIDAKGITETTVVKTFEEFRNAANAYPICKKIIVDGSFTIKDDLFVSMPMAIVVNKDVVMTIEARNCAFYGSLENNGEIIVNTWLTIADKPMIPNRGYTQDEYDSIVNPTGTGKIVFERGKSAVNAVIKNSDDIVKYFRENSVYNSILSTPVDTTTLLIDKDITIPEGCSIWLNINMTIKVAKGVTLTNYGKIETLIEPIVEGIVMGNKIIKY